ncbi:M28 family metallopeptidase [Clostridium sp. C8-1-8]|uniref:M28 family metallopeptidase n=1 Tax=Clostridium sp. C8-1-8 TaxID=2698831 RepID=UPI00136CF9F8|nr:M28 family metallopeptidase [Clostridium sp. C8-1-8]
MIRTIISLLLTISILLSNISLIYCTKLETFSVNNVLKIIDYLSSDPLDGRLSGSLGNKLAEQYIENRFISYKLLPLNSTYLEQFTTPVPTRIDGTPSIKVYDKKNNLIESYTYGVDFKDAFLNYRTNHLNIDRDDDFRIYPSALEVKKENSTFTFIVTQDNFSFRSSFISNSPSDMYIYITSKVYDDLITYNKKGYSIDCFIPYKVEDTELHNVVGFIKGLNPKLPPLIISSHFDHLGEDLSGNIYRGSLDNASGISFMLELCRVLSSMIPPDRNIIFVAFNAEELGLQGSKAFVNKNYNLIKSGKSINFDMIGGNKSIPMTIMSGENPSRSLTSKKVEQYCKDNNISFNIESKDSSDHASFADSDIDSITICDSDTSRIHTPSDNPQFIDPSSIKRDYKVSWDQIVNYCYSNPYSLIIYSKNFYVIGYCISLFLFIILLIPNKCDKKKDL